jgi:tRNA-dependent cyclodipeptide synthase
MIFGKPSMKRARVKVNVFPDGAKLRCNSERAFVGISLNNKTMASSNLLGLIFDWTHCNVGKFDLLVGDYLNRYNYQAFDGETEISAVAKAKQAGVEARKRLAPLISSPGSYENAAIISTATLCEHSAFTSRRAHFMRYYSDNSEFRGIVQEGVDAFLTRRHPQAANVPAIRDYCVAYQLEELVMFEQLARDGYGVFVYPGAQLPIMKRLVSKSFAGASADIEKLILVELRVFEDNNP